MNALELNVFKFFLTSQICDKETAISTFSELNNEPSLDSGQNFGQCVDAVNRYIKAYDLEIVEGKSEVTGQDFLALVQVCENSITINSKFNDKKTSAFFSKLLKTIALSDTGYITDTDAVNLNSEVDIAKGAAQHAVYDLLAQKWFEEKDGGIYLGPRSVLELGQLLSSSYPNSSKQCPLCKKILFFGISCNSCQNKIHLHCLHKFWELSSTCPSCKKSKSTCFNEVADVSDDSPVQDYPSKPKRRRRISD